MTPELLLAAAVVAAYLIGSLSFAVIVSQRLGLADPRSYGSGNPGATNVLRSGNKTAAALTLLFDALKGLIPVALVQAFGARWGLPDGAGAWVGLAAFLGHLWPVFFKFEGGKGVATAAGVLLGLHPALGAATLLTWVIVAYFFRYSSLAAIVAAVFAPFYDALLWGVSTEAFLMAIMSGLLVWRHSANINKLVAGKESKIGQKAEPVAVTPAHKVASHSTTKAGRRAKASGKSRGTTR